MKNKIIGICTIVSLMLSVTSVIAVVPSSSVITTDVSGHNAQFTFYTRMLDLVNDAFSGQSAGDLDGHQSVRIGESAQWAGDGSDIDRTGSFAGQGNLSVMSEYQSSGQWYPAHSIQGASVSSDTSGSLSQGTHFDYNSGGVYEIDQWKKQRNLDISADGNYNMNYGGHDLRNDNWDFSFTAQGTGSGSLFVDKAFEYGEHGSGEWYRPDSYNSVWEFGWTGIVNQNTNAFGNRGVQFTENVDPLNNDLWGNAKIW